MSNVDPVGLFVVALAIEMINEHVESQKNVASNLTDWRYLGNE